MIFNRIYLFIAIVTMMFNSTSSYFIMGLCVICFYLDDILLELKKK